MSTLKDIEVEMANDFWPPNIPEYTVVQDFTPATKSVETRRQRIMTAWHARSPHSKRMATVTQYTPFLALALPVLHQVFV